MEEQFGSRCEDLKNMYESTLAEKDKQIASQKQTICKYDEKFASEETRNASEVTTTPTEDSTLEFNDLKKEFDNLLNSHAEEQANLAANYEGLIKAKDAELASLKLPSQVENKGSSSTRFFHPVKADRFKIKPTNRSGKAINIQEYKCEFPGCGECGVDTIKCNGCDKWLCEKCTGTQLKQFKTALNKCGSAASLYLLCKECDENVMLNGVACNPEGTKDGPKITSVQEETSANHIQTRPPISEAVIDSKLSQFGEVILGTVSKIIDEKLSALNSKFENIGNIPEEINQNYMSFKEVLTKSMPSTSAASNLKSVMTEAKNKELVEDREKKLRSQNIIIHGVKDDADNAQAQKENDKKFVEEFMAAIGVESVPETIQRLGNKVEDSTNKRPIKLKLSSESEKDKIMRRLPNLKTAEDHIKRASVTHDYTIDERDLIRKYVQDAKTANNEEPPNSQFVWKVRGDPKNGLQIKKFKKRLPLQNN